MVHVTGSRFLRIFSECSRDSFSEFALRRNKAREIRWSPCSAMSLKCLFKEVGCNSKINIREPAQWCTWYILSSGKQGYYKPRWSIWPVSLTWMSCCCIQTHADPSAMFSCCLHSPVVGVRRALNESESASPGLPSSVSAPSFLKSFYQGSGRLLQPSEGDLSKRWERCLLLSSSVPPA